MKIADLNRKRYLRPPTFEEIEDFRIKLGVNPSVFERFYSLGTRSYYKIKDGEEALPARLWHIIYRNMMPTYIKIPKERKKKHNVGSTVGSTQQKKRNPTVTNSLEQLKQ